MDFKSQATTATLPAETVAATSSVPATWGRLVRLGSAWDTAESLKWAFALADQAVVSGTRLLTTILLGRFGGPEELGTFSLAFSVLLLAGCMQEALLTTPYVVLGSRLGRRARASYGGGILMIHALLATVGSVLLLAIAGLLWLGHGPHIWTTVALALAVAFPCSLLWEFARRTTLAHLDVPTAFAIDSLVAGLQLAGLSWLATTHRLTASHALWAVGSACLTVGGIWLVRTWPQRTLHPRLTGRYWARNWKLGRWLFAGQIVGVLYGLAPTWILAALVGTYATGAFVACMNLALLANPLIFTVGNLLTPRAARAYASGGAAAAARVVWTAQAFVAGALFTFAGLLLVWGENLVSLVYGASYHGFGIMPGLLGLCAAMWGTSAVFSSGLTAIKRPQWSFAATLAGTLLSAAAIVLAVPRWHSLGAATGMFVGSVVVAVIHIAAFVRCTAADSQLPRTARQP